MSEFTSQCISFVQESIRELFQKRDIDAFTKYLADDVSLIGITAATVCYDVQDVQVMLYIEQKELFAQGQKVVDIKDSLDAFETESQGTVVFGKCNLVEALPDESERIFEVRVSVVLKQVEEKPLITHFHLSNGFYGQGVKEKDVLLQKNDKLQELLSEIEVSKEKYRVLAEQSSNILIDYDCRTDTIKFSEKFVHKTGINRMVRGFSESGFMKQYIYEEDRKPYVDFLKGVYSGVSHSMQCETRIDTGLGQYRWHRVFVNAIYDKGQPASIVGKLIDIDKEKQEQIYLKVKATTDSLTKLYNKETFRDLVSTTLSNFPNEDAAFIIVDIDHFKKINDTMGHMYGDSVIIEFAQCIAKQFSNNSDLVGRIGGDEFGIYIQNISSKEELLNQMSQLKEKIASIGASATRKGTVHLSAGIALFELGMQFEQLFENADKALYQAKSQGRNQVCIFDKTKEYHFPNMNEKSAYLNEYVEEKEETTTVLDDEMARFAVDILTEAKEPEAAISMLLMKMGHRFSLFRIEVYSYNDKTECLELEHQWVESGFKAKEEKILTFPNQLAKEYVKMAESMPLAFLGKGSHSAVSDYINENHLLKANGSGLACGFFDQGSFKGCVVLRDFSENRKWSMEIQTVLQNITKILSTYLIKIRDGARLVLQSKMAQIVSGNQETWSYLVDPKTYEIKYITENVKDRYPNARVGLCCYECLEEREGPCVDCPIQVLQLARDTITTEKYEGKLHGWIRKTASNLEWMNGESVTMVCCTDVTKYMNKLASIDLLTGLPTVNKFKEEGQLLLNQIEDEQYFLLYIDIDHFQLVNDTKGYKVGDKVLVETARILSKIKEYDELIARAGSDHFVFLTHCETEEQVKCEIRDMEQKVAMLCDEYGQGMNLQLVVGAYKITNKGEDMSSAIDKANLARKNARQTELMSCCYRFYTDAMFHKIHEEKVMESKMIQAIAEEEFVVYLQPKVALSDRRIVGAEALVRWRNKETGLVPPDAFIPIMEKNGFIVDLDFYVYKKVFQMLRGWIDHDMPLVPISVNVSRVHINNGQFVKRFMELIDKYQIPHQLIELELTENLFLDNVELIVNIITQLKEEGFLVSIDDFGSGYSSLNLLKELPVDILKLDKEFFRKGEMQDSDCIIVSSVVNMAKQLDMTVLSEGVETVVQSEFLKTIKCDWAQGFLFAKPMPIFEFEKILAQ